MVELFSVLPGIGWAASRLGIGGAEEEGHSKKDGEKADDADYEGYVHGKPLVDSLTLATF